MFVCIVEGQKELRLRTFQRVEFVFRMRVEDGVKLF